MDCGKEDYIRTDGKYGTEYEFNLFLKEVDELWSKECMESTKTTNNKAVVVTTRNDLNSCEFGGSPKVELLNYDCNLNQKKQNSSTSIPSNLPWRQVFDFSTNRFYYWNCLTNEVSWTLPEIEFFSRNDMGETKEGNSMITKENKIHKIMHRFGEESIEAKHGSSLDKFKSETHSKTNKDSEKNQNSINPLRMKKTATQMIETRIRDFFKEIDFIESACCENPDYCRLQENKPCDTESLFEQTQNEQNENKNERVKIFQEESYNRNCTTPHEYHGINDEMIVKHQNCDDKDIHSANDGILADDYIIFKRNSEKKKLQNQYLDKIKSSKNENLCDTVGYLNTKGTMAQSAHIESLSNSISNLLNNLLNYSKKSAKNNPSIVESCIKAEAILETRIVDWKAGALKVSYVIKKLQELLVDVESLSKLSTSDNELVKTDLTGLNASICDKNEFNIELKNRTLTIGDDINVNDIHSVQEELHLKEDEFLLNSASASSFNLKRRKKNFYNCGSFKEKYSLIDKWKKSAEKAAKEDQVAEKHVSKDIEDRDMNIALWKEQQISRGLSKTNPNFTPLKSNWQDMIIKDKKS